MIEGGKTIRFDLVGQAGEPVSIEMPFDQAESIVMTIPRLLSASVEDADRRQPGALRFPRWQLVLRVGKGSELSNPCCANAGRFRSCVRYFF